MSIAAALAAGTNLAAGTTIADTARNISDNFDALQGLVAAGKIAAITPTVANRATIAITPAQVVADAATLALITGPYVLGERVTAAQAVAATSVAAGFQGLDVIDTQANVTANLDGLEAQSQAGRLSSIRFSDTYAGSLSLSAATTTADMNALSTIVVPYTIALTDSGTPTITLNAIDQATGSYINVLARITTPYSLSESAALHVANVASATTGLDRSADVFTTTNQSAAAVAGGPAPTTTLLPTGSNVVDSETSIGGFLDSLNVAAASGKLTSIVFNSGGVQTLSLTPTQLANDTQALAILSPDYLLSQIITVAQMLASPTLAAGFANFTIADTAANLSANLDAVDAFARAGLVGRIRVIGTAAPYFSLSAAQVGKDAYALSLRTENVNAIHLTDAGTPTITLSGDLLADAAIRNNVLQWIVGSYNLAVTGTVTASLAAALVSENDTVLASLTTPLTVFDSASNVAANLAALQTLAAAGKITTITLFDGGVPNLNLSPATISADAAALALISTPHINASVTSTPLSTTSARFVANLASNETQAEAGTLGAVTLTDTGTPTLSLTAAQVTADALAISKITSAYGITLTGTGTQALVLAPWQATAAIFTALGKISTPFTLGFSGPITSAQATIVANSGVLVDLAGKISVSDYATNIGTNLAALQTLAASGELGTVTLIGGAGSTLALTSAQFGTATSVLAAITTPFNLSETVTATAAATTTLSGRFTTLTVSDTATTIVANLSSLESLAVKGQIASIAISGATAAAPATLSLTAAQVGADADALSRINSAIYTITLTDPTPTPIVLQNWQIGGTTVPTVLTRISGSYTWSINGVIRPVRVTSLISAGGGGTGGTLVSSLAANSVQISDTAGQIQANFAGLEILATAGKIAGISAGNGLQTFNLASTDPTTYAAVFAKITTPYLVSQNITVAQIAGATLAAGFTKFTILDSSANIAAGLSQIETLAKNNLVARVAFTDTAPALSLSAAAIAANADALDLLNTAVPVGLTDTGTPTITLPAYTLNAAMRNDVLNAITTPYQLTLTGAVTAAVAGQIADEDNSVVRSLTAPLNVTDYGENLSANIDFVEGLFKEGALGNVSLIADTGTPTLTVTSTQLAADADVVAKIVTGFNEYVTDFNGQNAAIALGAGVNTVVATTGNDTITTGAGGNLVFLGAGASSITLQGTDTVVGSSGAATISATASNGLVFALGGPLQFMAGTGASTVVSGAVTTQVQAGGGNTLLFADGSTSYTGGGGTDTVVGLNGSVTAQGGAGGGLFFGGTAGNNVITAGAGEVTAFGGGAGDVLTATGSASDLFAGGTGAETLTGAGSSGQNTFFAGFGAETLTGGSGSTALVAGAGPDLLAGGSGVTLFLFVSGRTSGAADVITGFDPTHDFVKLAGYATPEATLVQNATLVNGSATLALPDGTHITFAGVAQLNAASFT